MANLNPSWLQEPKWFYRKFRAPTLDSLTEEEVLSLRVKREKAADEKTRAVSLDKEDQVAEDIVAKCCSFFRKDRGQKKRCQELANLSNGQVQKVLNKIFLEGKCCKEHVEGMVMLLLNPKVTEFNFLCLWEEEERRGFDKYDQLCLKCPNLQRLKTLKYFGCKSHNLYPQFKNMVSEHIILQKNLTLLALYGYTCSPQDLWLIQKNLPKLEHFEVVVQKVEMEIADPLGKMANLKRLDLKRSDYDNCTEESLAHILVECAAKVTKLETFIFKFSDHKTSQLFINEFFAKFPLRKLHLDEVKLDKEGLSFPWPKFLTCNSLELKGLYSDVQSLAGISFPLKQLNLESSQGVGQLLDNFGHNLEQLTIEGWGCNLDKMMRKCPKLVQFSMCDGRGYVSSSDDEDEEEDVARADDFNQLRYLTLTDMTHDMETDDYAVSCFESLLLKSKNLLELRADYVCFSKAALQAMDEDKTCFTKLQKLHVSVYFDDSPEDSAIAFQLARKMISRSLFLKKISIFYQSYDYKYKYHCKVMNNLAKSLKSSAKQLGIEVIYNVNDGF